MTWTSAAVLSVILGVLSLCAQLITFRKKDTLAKFVPVILLALLHVCNLVYYVSGLGSYDYNSIISHKEAISLMNAVLLGSAALGNMTAWVIQYSIAKIHKYKNGRTSS